MKFKSSSNNIVSWILLLLKVKHTQNYTRSLYNGHPHRSNLFGISNMLQNYGIESSAYKVTDKEKIHKFSTPFIAHASNNLVVVQETTDTQVSFIWGKGKERTSLAEFMDMWSGTVLLLSSSEVTGEPNYKQNLIQQLITDVKKAALVSFIVLFLAFLFFASPRYQELGFPVLIAINVIGCIIGYLLVSKQIGKKSTYADKLCSLFKKGSCNDLLESDASKFMGVISWSEIGLGYFVSNLLILLLFPSLIPFLAILNICALPYSFWSVWYQWRVAKQWCVLCNAVQTTFWIYFLSNLYFGFITTPIFSAYNIFVFGGMLLLPILLITLFVPVLIDASKTKELEYELASLRLNEHVFFPLLKQQNQFIVSRDSSKILLGNKNADFLITVLTNPYCDPCAKMHFRLEKLLDKMRDKICIQYIFSHFESKGESDLQQTNKNLIALYLQNELQAFEEILSDWFKRGPELGEDFFKSYTFDSQNEMVISEFQRHELWKKNNGLKETPTILINGFAMPKNYKVEDLEYFI